MAQEPTSSWTAPSTGIKTELYYATSATAAPTQVFKVQSIPKVDEAKDTIEYTALESETTYTTKGRKPAVSGELQILHVPEQYTAMKAVADTDTDVYWYVKLPTVGENAGLIFKWSGSMDISMSEIDSDMLMNDLVIGVSTAPSVISALPSGS